MLLSAEGWYLKLKENSLPGKLKRMHCPNQVLHDDNWRRPFSQVDLRIQEIIGEVVLTGVQSDAPLDSDTTSCASVSEALTQTVIHCFGLSEMAQQPVILLIKWIYMISENTSSMQGAVRAVCKPFRSWKHAASFKDHLNGDQWTNSIFFNSQIE